MNNGGFGRYFRNGNTEVIGHAPIALRTIGAVTCADIVERAIEIIAPLPPTQVGRYDALDALGDQGQDQFASLDSLFWAYPDNLTELLFDYVSQHPEAFGPIPSGGQA